MCILNSNLTHNLRAVNILKARTCRRLRAGVEPGPSPVATILVSEEVRARVGVDEMEHGLEGFWFNTLDLDNVAAALLHGPKELRHEVPNKY
jgi:hypothetical protein